MAELTTRPRSIKYLELMRSGWTEVVVPFADVDGISERNAWCRQNVGGSRGIWWDAVHIKYYFFAYKHHALMFKLACGGTA